ncbi:MAG: pyruvate carboxylase subunit B [Chloroflexi bacterium]|nr:pyruvate carboxylase subunit B [Chloroflexota bacterium]
MVRKTAADHPVKITDTTFRDAHQSNLATRMRTEDMEGIAPEMDRIGFYSMEVWGGATFDVGTRFLNEDPWERVRRLKRLMPRTPLQMLLRGQNLVGYRNYPDDVVNAFVHHAAETGIDIFRVFDAVNDERNFESSLKAIKECGKHAQLTLSYSLTERHLGGPVYNIDYFVSKARQFESLGSDSLCLKDMGGLISPYDAFELVQALKKAVKIPVDIHTHYTSGMASMSYLKAIEAGVDIIDTSLAPFALRTSQPAVEPLVVALQGTGRDTGLDLKALLKAGQYIETIAPKYRDYLDMTRMSIIDTGVLEHQIPGGMISNLVSQLKEAGALDRISEVYAELPRARKEFGYPPLVTPTSQIVGSQAVFNVLYGRYKMVSKEVKDYFYGLYGKPPVAVDPEIQKIVLKGYEKGEQPITCRAADVIPAEMEKAKEATKGLARDTGDILIYALYPTTGLRFLKWKYGLEKAPDDVKPKTMEDIKRENELVARARKGDLVEKTDKPAAVRGPGTRVFNVFVGSEYYQVEVDAVGGSPVIEAAPAAPPALPASPPQAPPAAARVPLRSESPQSGPPAAPAPPKPETPPAAPKPAAEVRRESPRPQAPKVAGEVDILSPMPGIIIHYEVKAGDTVKAGDPIVVIEAMKMQSSLPSPVEGTIKSVNFSPGDRIARDAVLAVVIPA